MIGAGASELLNWSDPIRESEDLEAGVDMYVGSIRYILVISLV